MALTGQDIISRVGAALNDASNTRWPAPELLEYISDAQRAAVKYQPQIGATTVSHPLVAGTRQTIPVDGYILIDVTRNMGAPGNVPGGAIHMVNKGHLDRWKRDWHTETAAEAVVYTYDIRNRLTFYVSPAVMPPHQVEIVYAKIPAEIANAAAMLEIPDIYQPAVLAYTLFRAIAKDISAEGQSMSRAEGYWKQFLTAIGAETEADVRIHPMSETHIASQEKGT